MNIMMYCESMDLELDQIFTECEAACNRAYARLLEEELHPSFYKEAEGDKKRSGGLFGFILGVLKSIKNLLSEGMKKLKSFLFGAEVGDNPNGQVKSKKDPEKVMDFVTKYNGDANALLEKAMRGEVSVEEAKQFIDQKKSAFGSIGPTIVGAASFLGISKIMERKMASWKAEIDEAYNTAEKLHSDGSTSSLTVDAAKAIARSSNSANKEAIIQQTAKLITDDMRNTNATGIKFIEDLIKTGYQERVIKQKLIDDAQSLMTTKGRIQKRVDAAKQDVSDMKYRYNIRKAKRNVEKGSSLAEKITAKRRKNIAKNKQTSNDFYNDRNDYVHKEDL